MENSRDDKRNIGEAILDLDFVPTWARSDSGVSTEISRKAPKERAKPKRQSRGKPFFKSPPKERPPRIERAPVRVDFIPEQHRLRKVVRILRDSKRAFPLMDISSRFMNNPAFYKAKCQVFNPPREDLELLYQNKKSRLIFLEKEDCERHSIDVGLQEFFDAEKVDAEAPSGNFLCVGRCTMGGEILGPPNYHGYEENVKHLHASTYPHMDSERFSKTIEKITDEEAVEKWKKEQAQQYRYQEKRGKDEYLSRKEAEALVCEKYLRRLVKADARCIIPGTEIEKLTDRRLRKTIEIAYQREIQNYFSIRIALRPALKHQKMSLFRAKNSETFVTAIAPSPLVKNHAIKEIQEVLSVLQENPGCARSFLLESLGKRQIDGKTLTSLRWLIDRGHVIEFFNGALSVPQS